MAPREKVILDDYVNKPNIPRTCARQVYKLTNKELDTLCKSTKKRHGFFRRTVMTLYSREKVLTLACKKYGCTRKNIAEVLQMDKPPIVNPLIEKPSKKTPQKKTPQKKKETPATAAPPSPPSSSSSSQASSSSSNE